MPQRNEPSILNKIIFLKILATLTFKMWIVFIIIFDIPLTT